jgi:hypothetical protein
MTRHFNIGQPARPANIVFDKPRRAGRIACGVGGALLAVVLAWIGPDRATGPVAEQAGSGRAASQSHALPADVSADPFGARDWPTGKALDGVDAAAGSRVAHEDRQISPASPSDLSRAALPAGATSHDSVPNAQEWPTAPASAGVDSATARVAVEGPRGSTVTTFGVATESVPADVAAALDRPPQPSKQVPEAGVLGMRPDTSPE